MVRRLGFGGKMPPNRISICASRRIRRYMIVLGFDDPRNSDLSTQRHNGRWPMAPWRQLFFGSESEPGSAANSDHIAQISDGRGRALRCRPREMSATSWGLFAIVILTGLAYSFWQRRSSGFLPVPTEEPQTTGSYQQEEDERLLRQAKSEGNRFITDVHL